MRRRFLFICVGITFAVVAAVILPKLEPIRSWRITQTQLLANGISMRVEDVLLFPTGTNRLLRLRCRWLGGNPNEHFVVRASIRASSESAEIDPKYVWQVGVPDDGRGGIPMIWAFRTAPEGIRQFVLRIYYRDQTAGAREQYVDFRIPYLPKVTPHGEI